MTGNQPNWKGEIMNISEKLDALGITVKSVFIPFSQSRNKDEKYHSLNWKVTVCRNDREILTTDYSAGAGHCPSYNKQPFPQYSGSKNSFQRHVCMIECEGGKEVIGMFGRATYKYGKNNIEPSRENVVYSLVMDSDVLNYGSFEDWGDCFGYDTDSREAEKIYHACLKTALKMNSAFDIAELQQLFEDY